MADDELRLKIEKPFWPKSTRALTSALRTLGEKHGHLVMVAQAAKAEIMIKGDKSGIELATPELRDLIWEHFPDAPMPQELGGDGNWTEEENADAVDDMKQVAFGKVGTEQSETADLGEMSQSLEKSYGALDDMKLLSPLNLANAQTYDMAEGTKDSATRSSLEVRYAALDQFGMGSSRKRDMRRSTFKLISKFRTTDKESPRKSIASVKKKKKTRKPSEPSIGEPTVRTYTPALCSRQLLWECVKNSSSFLRNNHKMLKRPFSAEPGNLLSYHSGMYSSLNCDYVLDVRPAKDGDKEKIELLQSAAKASRQRRPNSMRVTTGLSKCPMRGLSLLRSELEDKCYRRGLVSTALEKYVKVQQSFKKKPRTVKSRRAKK